MRARMRFLVLLFVAVLATPAVLIGSAGLSAAQVVNQDPDAHDDIIAVVPGLDTDLPVLANDTDPDGDPLTIVSFEIVTPSGSTIVRDTQDPNVLFYERGPTFSGLYDHFVYEIEDGNGGTDTGFVTVVVDAPLPPPSPIAVSHARVDFGAVPLGKTAAIELTITNVSPNPVGPFTFWEGRQRAPEPFETNTFRFSQCLDTFLQPGDSCTHLLRFWSVAGADAAAPAALEIFANQSNTELLTAVPMFAETAPSVPPLPNTVPLANDDFEIVNQPFDRTLDPTRTDLEADDDQLTIIAAADPPHGSVAIESCAGIGVGRSRHASCVHYTPDPGFTGADAFEYTISDGRGGTDTGVMFVAVFAENTPFPSVRIDSITPDHGPSPGGHTVTIDGANFLTNSSVEFRCNGMNRFMPSATLSTTQITVTVLPLPPGPCDVEVTTFVGSGELAGGYTVDGLLPTVLPGGGTVMEGDSGTRTMNVGVRLSAPSTQTVTVQWTTLQLSGSTFADGSNDYTPAGGVVTFAPGETSKTVSISVNGDTRDEPDEYVFVSFHSPTNAVVGGFFGLGYGVIRDDDPPPVVLPSISAPGVLEGNSGQQTSTVDVTLSEPSGREVTVQWRTLNLAGNGFAEQDDFTAASGVVTFAPGETSKSVPISVHGDTTVEEDEAVVVSFHHPTNATLGGYLGLGALHILNDD
jgi:hypothetical protein